MKYKTAVYPSDMPLIFMPLYDKVYFGVLTL